MAQPANTVSTYSAKGNREDLSNIIYRIDITEVAFTSNIRKTKASAKFHEWQLQQLAAAVDTNAQIEGDDATNTPFTPTSRVGNRTQIATKVASVTGTQDAVNKAGRENEMSYQVILKGLELRRDVEKQLVSNKPSVVGDNLTASQSAGFEAWIVTNAQRGATGANGGFAGGVVAAATDGTLRPFTETLLKAAQQSAYTAGGKPSMLMLGPGQKGVFSGFTGIALNRRDNKGNEQVTIVGGADVYVGDFGNLTVTPSIFSRNRTALGIDPKMAALAILRAIRDWALAKKGDSNQRQIVQEYTLEMCNEAAHFVVADLQ